MNQIKSFSAKMLRAALAWVHWTPVTMLLLIFASATPVAALERSQVLLVVNTRSDDSRAIRDAYIARHGPDLHIWEYDGSTSVTITRETFENELRLPLDAYLRNTMQGDVPLCQIIRAIVTTKGVPRRIDDFDSPGIGDNPPGMATECNNGKADAAAVDAELVLLHQQLRAGPVPQDGAVKYYANNHIRNPYYGSTSRISQFSRADVATVKSFDWNGVGWTPVTRPRSAVLGPGDMYLVCRLTGYTAAEAISLIDRGSGPIKVFPPLATVVIDRDGRTTPLDDSAPYSSGEDFPQTRDMLAAGSFNVLYDETGAFLTEAPQTVLGYTSYGRNHSPAPGKTYILDTLKFNLVPGAAFNTYESFNGRNFETPDPHDWQGQVADWVRIGGTLAFGHVWEPFAFSVADNEIFYQRMLIGTAADGDSGDNETWTFAEAAYASMVVLSWQNIVVGDPLTQYVLHSPDSRIQWQTIVSHGQEEFTDSTPQGKVISGSRGLQHLRLVLNKEPLASTVSADALLITGRASGDVSSLIESVTVAKEGDSWIMDVALWESLPDCDRYRAEAAHLRDCDGYPYYEGGALEFALLAGDVNGSCKVDAEDMLAARAVTGQPIDAANYHLNASGTGRLDQHNLLFIGRRRGSCLP